MTRQIHLDDHDEALAEAARSAIDAAFRQARMPAAVAKRIASRATSYRNRGRDGANRRHHFQGVCEASGAPLERAQAGLDELDPVLGYAGPVHLVSKKADSSGGYSCGLCQ